MVARVKDKGWSELEAFKRRVLRQKALRRLRDSDADWLVEKVEEIQRFVSRMGEKPDTERQFL